MRRAWVIGAVCAAAAGWGCVRKSAETGPEPAAVRMVDTKRRPSDRQWEARLTVTLESVRGFRSRPVPVSAYGGRTDRRLAATGFFRAQRIEGRWWFVDPEGFPMYNIGCCSVSMLRTDGARQALANTFGGEDGWATNTVRLLREHDFNTLGCWSDDRTLNGSGDPMPYCPVLNFMSSYGKIRGGTYQKPGHTGYPNDCIFALDPEFPAFCEKLAMEKATPRKNDPWLVGWFSDNEMPFRTNALKRFLQLPAGDAGRAAAEKWLAGRGGRTNEAEFVEFLADSYFRAVSTALRKADPNHLFLGSRMHGGDRMLEPLWRAAGRHVDVISYNYYSAWTPDDEQMNDWVRWSGKPFIITEWYAKGDDVGLANTGGAGWLVRRQGDRGAFYQNFTLGLLKNKGCAGWHWFKYQDNDPADTRADPSNRDANKGVVSNRYEPYAELLKAMKELNSNAYALIEFFDRP